MNYYFWDRIKLLSCAFGIYIGLSTAGCEQLNQGTAPTAPAAQIAVADSSAVVVNAEKTLRISKDTFDTFLHLEYDHKDIVKSKLPQVHEFAEYVRRNAPDWLSRANNAKNLYKHNRSSVNLGTLTHALDVLSANYEKAQGMIEEIKGL